MNSRPTTIILKKRPNQDHLLDIAQTRNELIVKVKCVIDAKGVIRPTYSTLDGFMGKKTSKRLSVEEILFPNLELTTGTEVTAYLFKGKIVEYVAQNEFRTEAKIKEAGVIDYIIQKKYLSFPVSYTPLPVRVENGEKALIFLEQALDKKAIAFKLEANGQTHVNPDMIKKYRLEDFIKRKIL